MSLPPSTPHRPLSPHLQIWRWHITMLGSIMHRVTGVGSTVGLIAVVAWLVCLGLSASGMSPEAYTQFLLLAKSPLGLVIWFLLSLGAFVHLTGGIRHWIWDVGAALQPKTANQLSFWTMLAGVLLTVGFWALLFASGKVAL